MKNIFLLVSVAFNISAFAQIPTDGLVGYYPFTGNANDNSGNSNNGTVNGATLTTDRFGNPDNAYYFNGSNANIQVANTAGLNVANGDSLSISCWIKHDLSSTNIDKYFISKYDGVSSTSSAYALGTGQQGNGYTWHQIAAGSSNGVGIRSQKTINDGSWHHFLSVLEMGGSTKLYIDGVLDTSVSFPFNGAIINSLDLYFGSGTNVTQFYQGSIDDIRIYNRGLTQPEINSLFNEGLCYQLITVTDTLIINANITGFNPITYENTIKIWPNPSNDHITIDNGNIASMTGYQIRITNSLSQQVFQSNITQQQFYVDLSTWTGNGLYFVHIIDGQGNTIDIRKIILQ